MSTTRRLSAAAAVLLLIGIVVLWVDVHCFCRAFYKQEYQKLNTAQSIGMTEQGLEQTTEALLAYLRGEQEDLSLSIPINGQEREVFNAREKAHMADVKTLYIRARWVGYGSLLLGAAGIVLLLVTSHGSARREVLGGYLRGNVCFFAALAMIGLFAAIDFDTFWTGFHKLVFANDLWLLDPRTDILIEIVPEQFFFDLVIRIAASALATIGALWAAVFGWQRKWKKRMVKGQDADAGTVE